MPIFRVRAYEDPGIYRGGPRAIWVIIQRQPARGPMLPVFDFSLPGEIGWRVLMTVDYYAFGDRQQPSASISWVNFDEPIWAGWAEEQLNDMGMQCEVLHAHQPHLPVRGLYDAEREEIAADAARAPPQPRRLAFPVERGAREARRAQALRGPVPRNDRERAQVANQRQRAAERLAERQQNQEFYDVDDDRDANGNPPFLGYVRDLAANARAAAAAAIPPPPPPLDNGDFDLQRAQSSDDEDDNRLLVEVVRERIARDAAAANRPPPPAPAGNEDDFEFHQ